MSPTFMILSIYAISFLVIILAVRIVYKVCCYKELKEKANSEEEHFIFQQRNDNR